MFRSLSSRRPQGWRFVLVTVITGTATIILTAAIALASYWYHRVQRSRVDAWVLTVRPVNGPPQEVRFNPLCSDAQLEPFLRPALAKLLEHPAPDGTCGTCECSCTYASDASKRCVPIQGPGGSSATVTFHMRASSLPYRIRAAGAGSPQYYLERLEGRGEVSSMGLYADADAVIRAATGMVLGDARWMQDAEEGTRNHRAEPASPAP